MVEIAPTASTKRSARTVKAHRANASRSSRQRRGHGTKREERHRPDCDIEVTVK